MNFFKIQTETLTNLANSIRKLDNSINALNPLGMQNNLSNVDTEINIQTELIRQIALNLENYINGETQKIITFTIDGNTYEALEGMTWAQWYISQYNTNNLIYCTYTTGIGVGDYVYNYATKSLILSINGVMQKDNDLIVANGVFEWMTEPVINTIPTVSGSLTYNGSAQSPTWNNYDTTKMTIGGTTSATNAGTYIATFTPISGYTWSDGTATAKSVSWSIAKAAGSLSINKTSMSLSTSTPTGTITVTRAGNGTISATSSNTSVATVSVSGTTVTVTGKGNGSATITIKVAAGTNHTAPSNKTCTVTGSFTKILNKYGTLNMNVARYKDFVMASNGTLLIIGGSGGRNSKQVEAYNSSLVHSTLDNFSDDSASDQFGGNIGSYVLIGGGVIDARDASKVVNAYNTSGTKSTPSSLAEERGTGGSASTGTNILFAGGRQADSDYFSSTVDVYNTSLTHSTANDLDIERRYICGIGFNNKALFAGGRNDDGNTSTIDVYTSTATKSSSISLSDIGRNLSAASIGGYCLITGHSDTTVDVFNTSLTRTTTLSLSSIRSRTIPVTTSVYAVFAGDSGETALATVDTFNSSLTRSQTTNLSVGRGNGMGGVIGDYVLIAGGYYNGTSANEQSIIDVYQLK